MIEYIKHRKDGTVSGGPFSDGNVYESVANEDRLWDEIIEWMEGGGIIDPVTPPTPKIAYLYAIDFWSRLTNEEADAVQAAMNNQPFRLRKIFETAKTFREDHELWPMLEGLASVLFGSVRAGEILAPSSSVDSAA